MELDFGGNFNFFLSCVRFRVSERQKVGMENATKNYEGSKKKRGKRVIKIQGERISLYVEANGVVEEHSVLWKGLGTNLGRV
jgi:hypothetical protein